MAKRPFSAVPEHAFGGNVFEDQLASVAPLVDAVWTQIAALAEGNEHVRVLVTSPQHESGTSLLASATASSLARHMRAKVLMVEAHMRQPKAASFLGVEGSPGFSDLLLGLAEMDDAIHAVPGTPDLELLPGGTPRPALAGEFATRTARELLGELTTRVKYTVFDAPPLTEHREARGLLSHVDAAVIVLRSRHSLKSRTAALAELIENARVPILGTVLNRHQSDLGFLQGALGAD